VNIPCNLNFKIDKSLGTEPENRTCLGNRSACFHFSGASRASYEYFFSVRKREMQTSIQESTALALKSSVPLLKGAYTLITLSVKSHLMLERMRPIKHSIAILWNCFLRKIHVIELMTISSYPLLQLRAVSMFEGSFSVGR